MKLSTENPPLLFGRKIGENELPTSTKTEQRKVDENYVKSSSTSFEGIVGLNDGSHALTISANARERLHASIIPNLLNYPGSVVVVDLTGEAYKVTAKRRKDMGQTIIRLDPFHVIEADTDALNPLDLLKTIDKPAFEATCQDIAALIPGFHAFSDIWEANAFGLLSGVIGYLASDPNKQKFLDLYSTFHSDDVVYSLAVVLDTIGKKIPPMSYSEISAFLQKADSERSHILSSITAKIKALNTEAVQLSFRESTVTPDEIINGKPVSVYIMLPPTMMSTHYSLLCIWIGTLLRCAGDRRFKTEMPMLFLLDETAKLLPFPQLHAAIASSASSNFRIWTFWQDLHQIRSICPGSWIFENCGAIQVFGTKDFDASYELAAFLGVEPKTIQSLATYEQILSITKESQRIKKLDYRIDSFFKKLFD